MTFTDAVEFVLSSHDIAYVVDTRGLIDTPVELLASPPVSKFVPEHDVAHEDHVSLVEPPVNIVIGAAFITAQPTGA